MGPRPAQLHLADEVQQQLALRAHQAGEQLWDPRQPLDGGHTDAVLVHSIRQRVFVIIKTQKPQHLRQRTSFSDMRTLRASRGFSPTLNEVVFPAMRENQNKA